LTLDAQTLNKEKKKEKKKKKTLLFDAFLKEKSSRIELNKHENILKRLLLGIP